MSIDFLKSVKKGGGMGSLALLLYRLSVYRY